MAIAGFSGGNCQVGALDEVVLKENGADFNA
jgi:hypothetical protein